jgi:hypothetical protein
MVLQIFEIRVVHDDIFSSLELFYFSTFYGLKIYFLRCFFFFNSINQNEKCYNFSFQFKLSNLKMDAHGKDKFIRLVGDRYNKETDEVTLTSDRCVFYH